MYRCQVCGAASKPKQKLLRHLVFRTKVVSTFNGEHQRKEIKKEVPVCAGCKTLLANGRSLESLASEMAPKAVEVLIPTAPEPLPPPPPVYKEEAPVDLGISDEDPIDELDREVNKPIIEKLNSVKTGRYGKVKSLTFRRMAGDRYKFGTLPPKTLVEAVEFVKAQMPSLV